MCRLFLGHIDGLEVLIWVVSLSFHCVQLLKHSMDLLEVTLRIIFFHHKTTLHRNAARGPRAYTAAHSTNKAHLARSMVHGGHHGHATLAIVAAHLLLGPAFCKDLRSDLDFLCNVIDAIDACLPDFWQSYLWLTIHRCAHR